MICSKIIYKNFRNIEKAELEFSPGTNIFVGSNAQGKTSAVEGIYLFARGKSFRCRSDGEMIKFGSEYASVDLEFNDDIRYHKMRVAYSRDGKRLCRYNGIDLKRLSEFIGHFRAVIFCPTHLSLVKDGPSIRRSFIDSAISQIIPTYVASLQKYSSILSQRNALIKAAYFDRKVFNSTVEYWSEQLACEAEKISKKRAWYIGLLREYANRYISDMTGGKEELKISYRFEKTKEEYFKELMSNHEREIKYGSTLYGIHKDDMDIFLGDYDARSFASQGQQRSIALSMKLSECEISKKQCGSYPILLLDDVLSELDSFRREYVLSGINDKQTFITSCNIDDFYELNNLSCFRVENGSFVREK